MKGMIIKSKNVQTTSEHSKFDIYKNSELLGTFTMAVFGLHDISNATSAIALADINGISVEKNSRITRSIQTR